MVVKSYRDAKLKNHGLNIEWNDECIVDESMCEWDKELIFMWVGANFVIEWEQSFICGTLLSCVTVAGFVVALAAR